MFVTLVIRGGGFRFQMYIARVKVVNLRGKSEETQFRASGA